MSRAKLKTIDYSMKIKTIILGATGMVGEGVLHGCLKHPRVESILVINRRSCGVEHEKLTEIIHPDFFDLAPIETSLSGYNACYFCLGISAMGMKEEDYRHVTYDLTMNFARTLLKLNPQMTFCYISGTGTDSSESGRSMWARVKGKTENDLMNLPFKAAFMFRPGYIQPTRGLKNTYKMYKVLSPFYPVWKTLFPRYVCTLEQLALAMINTLIAPPDVQILGNYEISKLAMVNG
jgi:uncharacterized protein YbjT (DUF2867 family)